MCERKTLFVPIYRDDPVLMINIMFDSEECANHGGAADGSCAQGDKNKLLMLSGSRMQGLGSGSGDFWPVRSGSFFIGYGSYLQQRIYKIIFSLNKI